MDYRPMQSERLHGGGTTPGEVIPRIIIHGGAGNITRTSVSRERYDAYQSSLRHILSSSIQLLSKPGATALDVATYAVTLLENDTLYNSGKGAVFTLTGTQEMEASVMVSDGHKKRGASCMLLQHVKNPVKLAREILVRGEEDGGAGAKDHCQYSGEYVEGLARTWGLDMASKSYFFTQRKWDEHMRGLKEEEEKQERRDRAQESGGAVDEMSEWEKNNYIPLGTCGAVVLDSFGTICAATSTGGLTNKVPGRIGDTPTMGAGYWAEEWMEDMVSQAKERMIYQPVSASPLEKLSRGDMLSLLSDCLPATSLQPTATHQLPGEKSSVRPKMVRHAVGTSSSGNGDSFVRLAAARTAAAKSRFTPTTFSNAISWMTGPDGELQKSAGDRWGRAHEGTGGMIGIELVGKKGTVVCDYNCGGMFRAWNEEDGEQKCLIFREDSYESGPKGWEDSL